VAKQVRGRVGAPHASACLRACDTIVARHAPHLAQHPRTWALERKLSAALVCYKLGHTLTTTTRCSGVCAGFDYKLDRVNTPSTADAAPAA